MINDYEATQPMTTDATVVQEGISDADVISTLNGLIGVCKDGQDGFMTAAEGIERSELKSVFYEFAHQRSQFAGVLQELVRSLGGEAQDTGSLSGAVHRGWMDIKSLVTGKDEEAILNECERGEDQAKEAYIHALNTRLPVHINDVVAQQSQAVLAAHNRVRALRNAEGHKTASSSGF